MRFKKKHIKEVNINNTVKNIEDVKKDVMDELNTDEEGAEAVIKSFSGIEGEVNEVGEEKGEIKKSRPTMTKNELIESVKNDMTKTRRVIKTVKVKDIK